MKVDVFSIDGKKLKSLELPEQFNEDYEPDLIKRVIVAMQNNRRQPYGVKYQAGMAHSAKLSRRRRDYKGAYGKGLSRVPRKTMWRRGMQFGWVAANAPGIVGGRRGHPPKAERNWELKVNKKERRKAIRSALAGVAINSKLVVVENKIEEMKKVKDLKNLFNNLEFNLSSKKIKIAGRGKSRGRKVKYKKNPLIVVADKCNLMKAASNLPGYDIVDVKSLNAELLSVGHENARKCLFTEKSLDAMNKEKLFTGRKNESKL